eukprot:9322007-Alexandrium_andersonii.AAC.1
MDICARASGVPRLAPRGASASLAGPSSATFGDFGKFGSLRLARGRVVSALRTTVQGRMRFRCGASHFE